MKESWPAACDEAKLLGRREANDGRKQEVRDGTGRTEEETTTLGLKKKCGKIKDEIRKVPNGDITR